MGSGVQLGVAAAIFVLVCGAVGSSSEAATFPEQVARWRLSTRASYDRSSLFSFIDGGAEVYLAYDFRALEVGVYLSSEKPEIAAEVYDMGSGDDAFGVLSVDPTGEHVDVGSMARYGSGLLRFCRGRWFVRILADRETPETRTAVLALGAKIAAGIAETSGLPRLLRALPEKGLQPDTTTYFHTQMTLNQLHFLSEKNLLQLGPDTEAAIADYAVGKAEAKLLIVHYPDAPRCEKARSSFATGYLEAGAEAGKRLVTQVEEGRFVGVEATGSHLLLVLEATNQGFAGDLLTLAGAKLTGGAKRE